MTHENSLIEKDNFNKAVFFAVQASEVMVGVCEELAWGRLF